MLVLERIEPALQLVWLDRPDKRNALRRAAIEELTAVLHRAREDASIRGIIVAGKGPSFCAGVDLAEFADGTPESGHALIVALRDLCAALRALPKPVACAIQGYCLGGALEIAACCDLRVCAPDARFGMPEVFLDIPSVIDALMLVHHVGAGRAYELMLTGEPIDAPTALGWGLVNRISEPGRLLETSAELLGRVVRHSAETIAAQKRLHQQWLELSYSQAVEASIPVLVAAFEQGRPQRAAAKMLRPTGGPL
jgi:enoyl-CoA hydratase/carnithine racemase